MTSPSQSGELVEKVREACKEACNQAAVNWPGTMCEDARRALLDVVSRCTDAIDDLDLSPFAVPQDADPASTALVHLTRQEQDIFKKALLASSTAPSPVGLSEEPKPVPFPLSDAMQAWVDYAKTTRTAYSAAQEENTLLHKACQDWKVIDEERKVREVVLWERLTTMTTRAKAAEQRVGEWQRISDEQLKRANDAEVRAEQLQRDRDLAIEGSRRQMVRAEAAEDKLEKLQRDLEATGALFKRTTGYTLKEYLDMVKEIKNEC